VCTRERKENYTTVGLVAFSSRELMPTQEPTTSELWYSQIQEIDYIMPQPSYNYNEKELMLLPIEIPLQTLTPNEDPRTKKRSFNDTINFTINMQELLEMFPESNNQSTTTPSEWPWTKQPLLQDDTQEDSFTESFLEYLNKELELTELQANANALDRAMLTPIPSPPTVEMPEDFTFSIMDMLTEDTWLTIDAIGKEIDENNFIPPTDFNP
jgi:hypothetical protein